MLKVYILLFLFHLTTPSLAEKKVSPIQNPRLEICNQTIEVLNNASQNYRFGLSVLGFKDSSEFVPLLAIAIDHSGHGPNSWMAVWNLNAGGTTIVAQAKAMVPNLWGILGGKQNKTDKTSGFPDPYLTWNAKKGRSWTEFQWTAVKTANHLVGYLNVARFFLKNYTSNRDDTAERRFFQTYTLLRLYEEARALQSSPDSLSAAGLTDLKYHLIINRSAFGLFAEGQDAPYVVSRFESTLREVSGRVSCYAHDEANQLHLGFEEIPYGLENRPPVGRAGLLTIRKSDLPEKLPNWPANNLFDLSYSPYTHPRIQELMAREPNDRIPLGIYILGSELRMKPVLLVDFLVPGNPRKREATGVLKVALDNFISLRGIPWFGRILKSTVDYGIDKKDISYFSKASAAQGEEAARLFARMQWNFDPDLNHLLIQSIEGQIGNPLVESSSRELQNLQRNYRGLVQEDAERLGIFLRTLYEDRIRRELDLGDKAVFAEDLNRYEFQRDYEAAMATVRSFNRQPHLPSISWKKLTRAWHLLEDNVGREDCPELVELADKMRLLYPRAVPTGQRSMVYRLLNPEVRVAWSVRSSERSLR